MTIQNPVAIQQHHFGGLLPPLILIHDGGGTISSYQALGDLGRDVYGIFDPRLEDGSSWDGGISEMGELYSEMISDLMPGRDILLGGWSLGGLICLEVARLLARNQSATNVVGIVMIDSLFPPAVAQEKVVIDMMDLGPLHSLKPYMRIKIRKAMLQAREMVSKWDFPDWTGQAFSSNRSSTESLAEISMSTLVEPPPVVLLIAREPVPSRVGLGTVNMLGWDRCKDPVVKAVHYVPGHHFTIFEKANVDECTRTLAETLVCLENGIA